MAGRRQISVRSISADQAIVLREAMTTYLRLYAPAQREAQAVCEQFVAMIDDQLRGQEPTGDATITLSPTGIETDPDGIFPQTFDVTLSGEGTWTASSADMWLHVQSPMGPQVASGTVSFLADENNGLMGQTGQEAERTGTIQVNDAVFTVNQKAWDIPPVYLTPTSKSMTAAAGAGTFDVTINGAGYSGTWTVTPDEGVTVISPTTPQSENGPVNFTVEENTGPARVYEIWVNGKPFTINQAAGGA